MEDLRSVEEINFDNLVDIRLKARKARNHLIIEETQEEFDKVTKAYIKSVYDFNFTGSFKR